MANVRHIQTNFTGGEISPAMYGRTDTSRFANGAKQMINFCVEPQGGAYFRQGTGFIAALKYTDRPAILQKFEFSETELYMLEIGDGYIRIFKDAEPLVYTQGAQQGEIIEVATPYGVDDLSTLSFAQSGDILFIAHASHRPRMFSRIDENTWTLEEFEHRNGPYLDGEASDAETTLALSNILNRATITSSLANDFDTVSVGDFVEYYNEGLFVIAEVITKVSEQELVVEPKENIIDINTIDPKAKLSYATGGDFPDRIRSTLAIWSSETEHTYIYVDNTWYLLGENIIENEDITPGGTKKDWAADVIEVVDIPTVYTPGGTISFFNHTITATLTATPGLFIDTRDVGRVFEMQFGQQRLHLTIDAVNSATSADVTLDRMMPLDPTNPDKYLHDAKTRTWRAGAWYTGNWPAVLVFDNNRLVFAATSREPTRYWYSVTDDYNNFAPTSEEGEVLDTSAITRALNAQRLDNIVWLDSGPVMLIGTLGSEFQVKPSALSEPLSNKNIFTTRQTAEGSAAGLPALRIGTQVLYVQPGRTRVRALEYDYSIDQYKAEDITIFASHILKQQGGVVTFDHRKDPISELWFATDDGNLVVCAYEREHNVIAYSNVIIAGTDGQSGFVEWVETLGNNFRNVDDVYIVVRRIINGVETRVIEVISSGFEAYNTTEEPREQLKDSSYYGLRHLDSHIAYLQEGRSTVRTVQLAFLIDDTGSMGGIIGTVKNTIDEINAGLVDKFTTIEYALVAFKDEDDGETRVLIDFAPFEDFRPVLQSLTANGGGDTPENGYGAIVLAGNALSWTNLSSVSRHAILFTDAISHERGATYGQALTSLLAKNIYFSYGMVERNGYRELAQETDGLLLKSGATFVDNFLGLVLGRVKPPITSLDGLDHLAGTTVTVLADGCVRGEFEVTPEGIVNFGGAPAYNVVAGLPYTGKVTVMPIDIESQAGTTSGKMKRVREVTLRLVDAFCAQVSATNAPARFHEFRPLTNLMGAIQFPFTGDWKERIESKATLAAEYTIEQVKPYPLKIVSATATLEIND